MRLFNIKANIEDLNNEDRTLSTMEDITMEGMDFNVSAESLIEATEKAIRIFRERNYDPYDLQVEETVELVEPKGDKK